MNALRGLSTVVVHWRLRRIAKRRVPMKALTLLLVVAAACSATAPRPTPTSQEPVGCCCTYGNCREGFGREACVSAGEFEGWTDAWHAGPCTNEDTYPASDRL